MFFVRRITWYPFNLPKTRKREIRSIFFSSRNPNIKIFHLYSSKSISEFSHFEFLKSQVSKKKMKTKPIVSVIKCLETQIKVSLIEQRKPIYSREDTWFTLKENIWNASFNVWNTIDLCLMVSMLFEQQNLEVLECCGRFIEWMNHFLFFYVTWKEENRNFRYNNKLSNL